MTYINFMTFCLFFCHGRYPEIDFLGWIWGEENDGEIIIICFILFFEAERDFVNPARVLDNCKSEFFFWFFASEWFEMLEKLFFLIKTDLWFKKNADSFKIADPVSKKCGRSKSIKGPITVALRFLIAIRLNVDGPMNKKWTFQRNRSIKVDGPEVWKCTVQ